MFNNVYKNRRVLITGHTGFKGSWLVTWLQLLGANLFGIALKPNTIPSHFSLLKSEIKSYICDIRDYNKLEQIIKKIQPEFIFHLAAQPLVIASYKSPLYTFATNVIGTANILELSRKIASLRGIVIVTSDKCYQNREILSGYKETDPLGGYDPYSASKAATEIVAASYRNSFFNVNEYGKKHGVLLATARAGNVIGGGDWAEDRLIPDIVRANLAGGPALLRYPQAVRPWQHVLDCLSGYLLLGQKLLQGKTAFADSWNFAPNFFVPVSVFELAQKMRYFWPAIQIKTRAAKVKSHETNYLKLDVSKACSFIKVAKHVEY